MRIPSLHTSNIQHTYSALVPPDLEYGRRHPLPLIRPAERANPLRSLPSVRKIDNGRLRDDGGVVEGEKVVGVSSRCSIVHHPIPSIHQSRPGQANSCSPLRFLILNFPFFRFVERSGGCLLLLVFVLLSPPLSQTDGPHSILPSQSHILGNKAHALNPKLEMKKRTRTQCSKPFEMYKLIQTKHSNIINKKQEKNSDHACRKSNEKVRERKKKKKKKKRKTPCT
ncbi:hypothetical protein P170DRAFT_200244 [Aspergillus steynii IBT 23096]|uniref:Uncharacterized protein n=1 Tax=Aspergillus steynii IBT 23096 TaxID=1392250 RepID=A0A2I2G4U9_9EURO|nr:uncharacterized protein P170DRAFT_200244 [Aspergillus steynii IBT 23096]PLB47906.1 hypothetical protein P170DRAFT_200244 [Aspergillus steynii IBT 23096]